MKKILLAVPIILIASAVFAERSILERNIVRGEFVPEPRLIAPTTEEVVLTGRDTLEFKWSPHEGNATRRDYYDFRLYKGRNMYQSAMIFKKRIPHNEFSVSIKSDIFKDGQVYTWSLRQVYIVSFKSRRSYASFKITKK